MCKPVSTRGAFPKVKGGTLTTRETRATKGVVPGFRPAAALRVAGALFALFAASSLRAESYVGAAGALVLPQGGSELRRVGGAAVRGGAYLSDFWALEGEAAWLEDSVGLAVSALVHVQAWPVYGDLFGYSSFDPFVTAGACGWLDGCGSGQVGPQLGLGAFWHLDDHWSLRADASATLGVETDVEVVYSLAVGVQYGF